MEELFLDPNTLRDIVDSSGNRRIFEYFAEIEGPTQGTENERQLLAQTIFFSAVFFVVKISFVRFRKTPSKISRVPPMIRNHPVSSCRTAGVCGTKNLNLSRTRTRCPAARWSRNSAGCRVHIP